MVKFEVMRPVAPLKMPVPLSTCHMIAPCFRSGFRLGSMKPAPRVENVIDPALPNLDKLMIGNNSVNAVFFDDIYISTTGLNSTIPRPLAATPPVSQAPKVTIGRSGAQLDIGWTEGTLESAASVAGPWSAVSGAAAPSYKVTPDGTPRFFRVRR